MRVSIMSPEQRLLQLGVTLITQRTCLSHSIVIDSLSNFSKTLVTELVFVNVLDAREKISLYRLR